MIVSRVVTLANGVRTAEHKVVSGAVTRAVADHSSRAEPTRSLLQKKYRTA